QRLEEELKREQELHNLQKALQEEREALQRQCQWTQGMALRALNESAPGIFRVDSFPYTYRAEQKEAQQRAQQEHQMRANDLEEQQAQLEAQRRDVEHCRERGEAERDAKLQELQKHQEELHRHREELDQQQREEEALRKAQAETFQLLEQELKDRAENISFSEQALASERQQILRSRGQLAMVQAHVVSLLGKDKHGEPGKPDSHILDTDEPEAELDAPEGEDMWNMDWSAVTAAKPEEGVAIH
ncbi:Hypothetical protein SCF082_LOCUS30325, partial [Durusdinium trenchii]